MKYFIYILLLLYGYDCSAQVKHSEHKAIAKEVCAKDLFGKWKVENWIGFSRVSGNDMAEYEQDRKNCLKALVSISKAGIKIKGKGEDVCYYLSTCDTDISLNTSYSYKTLVADSFDVNGYDPYNLGTNIVSKNFAHLIDKQYQKPKLLVIDTGCFCDYGAETLKICIANKNKIAIYRGDDLLILKRVE